MWNQATITDVGAALLASWLEGTTLTICEAAGGTGTVAEDALHAQTALASRKQTASIVSQTRDENATIIKIQFPANATAYTLNQIGIYAKLDNGSPVLLAVYQDATGIAIPASSTSQEFVFTFAATIAASGDGDIDVTIDSGAYVTQAELEAAVADAGIKPQVNVTVPTGSVVTATDGTTTYTAIAEDNACSFMLPGYGVWTFSATNYDQTSSVVELTVDQVRQYSITLSYFSATVNVTAENGASVTLTDGTHTYTGTCGSTGRCAFTVRYAGTYTARASLSGVNSSSATVNASVTGATYNATVRFITLTVTVDSGSTVSVSNGGTTKTGTSTGSIKFYLPNTGTWAVSATLNGEATTGSVACSSYTGYSITLSYVKVFGVVWSYNNSSTALARLTKENDPNGYVTTNIVGSPAPAVGTGSGSSPFDSFAPWNAMEEYNIISNAVSHRRGSPSFSRSAYDTVVYIPEFWYAVVDDASAQKRYFYIADKPRTGFEKHPGSGKYVGRYNTISGYYSKTGSVPLVSITRATARTNSKAKGTKWGLYDFASWCAVWLLYLVEFADWNSQAKIGQGVVNASVISNGGTDTMTYHTGRASGTDGYVAVQYRHIENPWGNVWEWIDGYNGKNRVAYICTNPNSYADDTETGYTNTGVTLPSDGYIKKIARSGSAPWAFLPSEVGGSTTTYIPDYVYTYDSWRTLFVGGYYGNGSDAGLFCFYAGGSSSFSYSFLGARLLFHP